MERAEMSRRTSLIGLLFLVLLFAASAVLFLPIPFTRDQGIYSYVAWCWVGEWWPYKFAFEHKGPNLYLMYAIFLSLSKGATWGPNLGDLLARVATVLVLFLLGRRAFNDRVALLGAFFATLPLLSVFSSCWWNDQAETFMMPLSPLAVLLAFESSKREKTWPSLLLAALSGLAASQMIMFKPSSGWILIALAVFLFTASRRRLQTLSAFSTGAAAGVMAWILYFWLRGISREFFEEVVLFNLFHVQGQRAPAAVLAYIVRQGLWINFGPGMILAAAGIIQAARNRKDRGMLLCLLWLLAGILEIGFQARFFLYHFLLLIPAMSVLMALGADLEIKLPARAWWRALAAIVVLVWLFYAGRVYYANQSHYRTWDYLKGRISREQYLSLFQEPTEGNKRDFNALADYTVAAWVRERTSPDDYVLVFGYEPLVNYLSARRSPSRFHSDYPLNFEPRTALAKKMQDQWRGIFLSELGRRRPKLVVLVHNDINALEQVDSYEQAQRFPAFWDWLNSGYHRGERIEDFEFWWRENK
jgi:4-amino-4-deoxy-L-arabinose transferase-like glycosyltransferase